MNAGLTGTSFIINIQIHTYVIKSNFKRPCLTVPQILLGKEVLFPQLTDTTNIIVKSG